MTARERGSFFTGVNSYVPNMQYAANAKLDQPVAYSLGKPAAVATNTFINAANAQAAANTVVNLSTPIAADSTYGRTVRFIISGDPGAAGSVVEVFGFDYLNQPMRERFSVANGSTAIVYGQKAFKTVAGHKIITQSTNAVTFSVGTGFRLGLPYKGDLDWAKEGGVFVPLYKRDQWFFIDRDAAEAIAGGTHYIYAPFPGYVNTLQGLSGGAGGATDPVITVTLGGVAIVGLTVTIDTSVAGNQTLDTPTTLGYNANNRFVAGSLIAISGAAAAGAGPDSVGLLLTPTQYTLPDLTDPATVTTGDTRGTYEALVTYDGVKEIIVGLLGDDSANSSNNGGLHGIKQAA